MVSQNKVAADTKDKSGGGGGGYRSKGVTWCNWGLGGHAVAGGNGGDGGGS